MSLLISLLLAFPLLSLGSVLPSGGHLHSRPPSAWFHEPGHPVHRLFRRGEQGDVAAYPPVGSSAWSSEFPKTDSDLLVIPKAWNDALDAAIREGAIPDIPFSSETPGTNPVYPPNVDPLDGDICSGTYKCKHPDDVWDAPPGVFGIGFDDGPQPYTPTLVNFLESNNLTTTHFVIGTNILDYPHVFREMFDKGHDLAVHTWTHPYMTTLSNERIIAELGWTMRLIHDSTGGRLPRFWRPPYGDCDNRVRAIAKVFGLTTIMWNQDTRDWSLITGGTTPTIVQNSMQKWLTGPKTPGLIILEHETSNKSVDAFINIFPLIKSNGWSILSVAQLGNGSAYYDTTSSDSSSAIGLMNDYGPLTTMANATTQLPTTSQSASLAPPTPLLHKQPSSLTSPGYVSPGQLVLDSGAHKPDIPRTFMGGVIFALSFGIAQHTLNY